MRHNVIQYQPIEFESALDNCQPKQPKTEMQIKITLVDVWALEKLLGKPPMQIIRKIEFNTNL